MSCQVFIVGARHAELQPLLTESGYVTSHVTDADLSMLAHPTAVQPDVLLLDLRGAAGLPPGLAAVKRQHPTPVLVVATALDPALMLEAMRAGVNECVAEPLTAADLQAAIGRLLLARAPASRSGRILAFTGAKGGVGTTTTAVNVATALAKVAPGETLFVDLHLAHGDAAIFLGAEARFSVIDALENTHRFDESFFRGLVTHTAAGPDLLASCDSGRVLAGGTPDVRALLAFVSRLYSYTVLDVPRSDPAMLDSLDHASHVVVVVNQDVAAARNASRLMGALRRRYGADHVVSVVNRFDREAEINHADMTRALGAPLKHVVPSDYRRAVTALNEGRPLCLGNHNKLAASYRELARDLAGLDPERHDEPSGGIFGRLLSR